MYIENTKKLWRRPHYVEEFHSENELNVSVHTSVTDHFGSWIYVQGKFGQENHMTIFENSAVFVIFSVHWHRGVKEHLTFFKFLWFEERFRQAPFQFVIVSFAAVFWDVTQRSAWHPKKRLRRRLSSWRISMDGRPYCRINSSCVVRECGA